MNPLLLLTCVLHKKKKKSKPNIHDLPFMNTCLLEVFGSNGIHAYKLMN